MPFTNVNPTVKDTINQKSASDINVLHIRNPVLVKSVNGKYIDGISNLGGVTIAFVIIDSRFVLYSASKVSSTYNFNKKIGRLVTVGRLIKSPSAEKQSQLIKNNAIVLLESNNLEFTNVRSASVCVLNDYLNKTNKVCHIYKKRIVQVSEKTNKALELHNSFLD